MSVDGNSLIDAAIGERGDVIFLIVYAGPDASVAAVEGLARRQYDLL